MGKIKCVSRDKVSDNYHDNVRDEEGQSSIIKQPPNVNSACKNKLDGIWDCVYSSCSAPLLLELLDRRHHLVVEPLRVDLGDQGSLNTGSFKVKPE